MAWRCDVCQKGPMAGKNVSHSKRHTPRRFMPNLQVTRLRVGTRLIKARVCTRCIRTQTKAAR